MLIIAQITGIIYKNIKTDLFNGKGKQYYNIKRGIIMPNFTQLQQQLEAGIQNNINAFLASNKNPNQNFINAQIQTIVASKTSELRHKLLQDYAQYCGRNVISYYSTWLQSSNLANPNPELMINDNDMNGLMNAVSARNKVMGLDLILHTPGGVTTATESIVKYLRKVFNNDIRVIVPHMAMSAGTMIACASKEIYMGKQSSLGPIDPQYKNVPAEGVLAEFQRAVNETVAVSNKSLIWKEIIRNYTPTFVGECDNVVRLSKSLVDGWLRTCMFKNSRNKDAVISKILGELASHQASMVHDKHYDYNDCKKLGLKVYALEKDQVMQDHILSIHHSYVLSTYKLPNSIKYIESDKGMSFLVTGNR